MNAGQLQEVLGNRSDLGTSIAGHILAFDAIDTCSRTGVSSRDRKWSKSSPDPIIERPVQLAAVAVVI